nr:helix-turn-helix domain-containing protein [Enterococcus sp. 669A]
MIRESLVLLQNNFFHTVPGSFRAVQSYNSDPFVSGSLERVRFSKTEKRLFQLLIEHQRETLSRKEICAALWRDGETSSNQSQLSCIVAKIKSKLKAAGYEGETLITRWGKGYTLDTMFCQFLQTNQAANVTDQLVQKTPELDQTAAV